MDAISHYMVAYAAGRKRGLDRPLLMALTLGAVLPDFDAISMVFGYDAFRQFHGTYTHSLAISILLALLVGIPFFLRYKKNVALYSIAGVLMHFVLDFVNSLSPMVPRRLTFFLPFSDYGIVLSDVVPYPTVVWAVLTSAVFVLSLYLLISYIRRGEYPWRIWLDDRKLTRWITRKNGGDAS